MGASLAMGGYAGYLFTAYGVTALVIVGNIVAARRRFRLTRERLRIQLDRRVGGPVSARAAKENPGGPTIGRES